MEFHIRKAVPGDLQDIMGLVASSVGKDAGVRRIRNAVRYVIESEKF